MDLPAVTVRPGHYVIIQLRVSHDALLARSPAPVATAVMSSSFSDALAGSRREARQLYLRKRQSHLIIFTQSYTSKESFVWSELVCRLSVISYS